MKYLLDTCVLSECTRRTPDPRLLDWLAAAAKEGDFYVSVVTIGEIAEGIAALPDGDAREAALVWGGASKRLARGSCLP